MEGQVKLLLDDRKTYTTPWQLISMLKAQAMVKTLAKGLCLYYVRKGEGFNRGPKIAYSSLLNRSHGPNSSHGRGFL